MAVLEGLAGDTLLREMARRAHDKLAVFNPRDIDYFVIWDSYPHKVYSKNGNSVGFPKGTTVMERYLAEKYVREMKDILIHEKAKKEVDERNEALSNKGMPKMTPQEQELFEGSWKTTRPELVEEMYKMLNLGVVEEFGIDNVPLRETTPQTDHDMTEKMMKELDRPYKAPPFFKAEQKKTVSQDDALAAKKAKLVSEVAAK